MSFNFPTKLLHFRTITVNIAPKILIVLLTTNLFSVKSTKTSRSTVTRCSYSNQNQVITSHMLLRNIHIMYCTGSIELCVPTGSSSSLSWIWHYFLLFSSSLKDDPITGMCTFHFYSSSLKSSELFNFVKSFDSIVPGDWHPKL